ncbi:cytoplasmic protein [Cristinia sonorae]|uniref:Cytoplasmic protein n=1 Tax=Cristinia sonorae TaxID=1940300 RepID=A0A8K0UMX0_9AGAR|nr:cytoplasmic protein [Cristinia sonorae]
MEIYTTSFTYPRRSRLTHSPASSLDFNPVSDLRHKDSFSQLHQPDAQGTASPSDYEAVQKLVMMAMAVHGVHVTFASVDQGRAWNFQISGAYPQVMAARGMVLKECPIQNRAVIRVARSDILDSPASKPTLKPEIRRRLDDIASQTFAHIAVVNSPLALSTRSLPDGISSSAGWSGLETERVCELVITGQGDSVELARVRLLVMLDELSGLHAESVELDHKLHPLICARKRNHLQTIQEETATNIYLPSALQGVLGPDYGQVSQQIVSRDAAILPRKLDWLVTDRNEDIKALMHDNATFIQFPPIGSSTSLIKVFGEHRVHVQRTLRSIMQLACQYYVASLWLLPAQFNVLMPSSTLNPNQAATIIKQVSHATGAEVVFKGMCFEMHGLEHEVRAAVTMLLELDIVKAFHHEIRFQIELANEHREFISGKKNGKINKIMQMTNVKIKFETFNDHNFLIDIAGNDASVLQGLALLQEELPAEISFHVPETYHKRIIGVGGRSIQRIMKKYGVYVKFSNAEEFAATGGYNENEDNVIARTPAKNAMNLDNLKQSVLELVNPRDKDYINEIVSIPRKYHRTLLGEKSIFVHDIEAKTNSKVHFPDKETASDLVTVFGPESQVQIAVTMLLEHVPFEADMAAPPHPELTRICSSPEFLAFAERVKRDFQVVIVPNVKSAPTANGVSSTEECSFKFRCQRSNSDFLVTAREMLEQFLVSHNVHIYPSATSRTHKRGDSFADAFPHFDSKVLSTARTRHQNSADLGRPSESMIDRRLRMASSSPDVKALFNNNSSPSYIYHVEEEDDYLDPQPNYVPGPATDYWQPMAPIGSGVPARTRQSDDSLKRGSDSLLESKLKDSIAKPRSLTNRAQSLDLTYSLSRITEGASRSGLSRPDSPENSVGDTGGSSPTSLSNPSFPSVYSPLSSRSGPKARAGVLMDDEGVDEVSRVISNLGL